MSTRGRVRFLADDIWDTPEDGSRYEVIAGEMHVTPAPGWLHQFAVGQIQIELGSFVKQRRLGVVVPAPVGVVLSPETAVQPDLVYVSHERREIITERGVEGAPDLVVEVLSPSTASRDRGVKMRAYARAGVPHYWLLDPREQVLEAFVLREDGYEAAGRYAPDDTFRPGLFPDFALPVADLWE